MHVGTLPSRGSLDACLALNLQGNYVTGLVPTWAEACLLDYNCLDSCVFMRQVVCPLNVSSSEVGALTGSWSDWCVPLSPLGLAGWVGGEGKLVEYNSDSVLILTTWVTRALQCDVRFNCLDEQRQLAVWKPVLVVWFGVLLLSRWREAS